MQSSWPTAGVTFPVTNAGALHAIPLISESFISEFERDVIDTLYNKAGRSNGQITAKYHRGGILCQAMYNNLGQLLVCAMGYECPNDSGSSYHGSPEVSSGKYIHIYELDEILAEEDWSSTERLASGAGGGTYVAADDKIRFGSLFFDKQVSSWVFTPVMWDKMIIQANFGRVTIAFEGLAQGHARSDSAYPSTGWTMATDKSRLLMANATFSIGSLDGSTLPYAARGITDFELILERGLSADQDTASTVYIKEPQINQSRKVSGTFSLARYQDDAYLAAIDADKPCRALLSFASGSYKFQIYMPNMTIKTPDHGLKGPGIVRPKYAFELAKPASDPWSTPSDYANIQLKKLNEFWILAKNDDAANWLRTDPT
jgi:hypothetical protein